MTLPFDHTHDLNLGVSRSESEIALSQEWGIRLIMNEKDVSHPWYWLVWPWWADVPDSDRGDFRRRRAVDISSWGFVVTLLPLLPHPDCSLYHLISAAGYCQFDVISRDHIVYAPGQWETTLQCNIVSHWLSAFTKWPPASHCHDVTLHWALSLCTWYFMIPWWCYDIETHSLLLGPLWGESTKHC